MKKLQNHVFNAAQCRIEWHQFNLLLQSKPILGEQKDILPFFKNHHNLSILLGDYVQRTRNPNVFAHEFPIYGDFSADLIIGNSSTHYYLLVEFEDGRPDGIFRQKGKKTTPEWSPCVERAYSQLVDWIWKLEDMRHTSAFETTFGSRRAAFEGLIVSGKDMVLSPQEQNRLRWRVDRTMVDSSPIACVSFNQLSDDFDSWLTRYHQV